MYIYIIYAIYITNIVYIYIYIYICMYICVFVYISCICHKKYVCASNETSLYYICFEKGTRRITWISGLDLSLEFI